MMPPGPAEHLAQADVVFVGTVQVLVNQGRTATFAVEEQWHGERLPATVHVHGGPDDPNSASSVDRSYDAGMRYLVAAYIVEQRLTDNACSATQPWSEELLAFRPADYWVPTSTPADENGGLPLPVFVGLIAVGAVALVGFVAFRPPRPRSIG